MSRSDDALMRLYESADVRDELTDDEAKRLLQWAQGELTRLDAAASDDAAFQAHVDTLFRLLKQVNRYAGRQGQITAQDAGQVVGGIASLATDLGHAASADQIAAAATGDPGSTIEALTGLLSQTAPPKPPTLPLETHTRDNAANSVR